MKRTLIKRAFFITGLVLLSMWAQCAVSAKRASSPLFNVVSSGDPANINITLCLNANEHLSCQSFEVPDLIMQISTKVNRVYPYAGIKLNTPGYALDCVPNTNGFCLLQLSNTPTQVTVQSTFPQSSIKFNIKATTPPNYIVGFSVDLVTPDTFTKNLPAGPFTVALWPGLQPIEGRECFNPINLGVLQPVLTYGNTCAPFKPKDRNRWWISGQYVNNRLNCEIGQVPNAFLPVCNDYAKCHGGPFINLSPGQKISTSIDYDSTTKIWKQTIKASSQTQTYSIALDYCSGDSQPNSPVSNEPQLQTQALLSVETHGYNNPLTQTFENIVIQVQVTSINETCDSTFVIIKSVPSSSCTPFRMISNTGTLLTCAVDKCTINKPFG